MKLDRTGKLQTALVLAAIPSVALASDPTPLFVLFFGVPAVTLSIALVALSYLKPRFALVPDLAFLVAHIPLMAWAYDAGYMTDAGQWLYISCGLSVCALLLSLVKRKVHDRVERRGT